MKRVVLSIAFFGSVFVLITCLSNLPVRGNDRDRDRDRNRELTENEEIQQGLAISPVKLNLDGKDVELVGLGSYIVNTGHDLDAIYAFLSAIPHEDTPRHSNTTLHSRGAVIGSNLKRSFVEVLQHLPFDLGSSGFTKPV